MKPIEEVNIEDLQSVCQELNQFLDEPIETENREKEDLIQEFTVKIEGLTEEEQGKLPDVVSDFYNDLYRDESDSTEPEKQEAEPAEEKKEEPAAKEEAPAKEEKKEAPKEEKKETKAKKDKKEKEKKEKAPAKEKKKLAPKDKPKDEFGFVVGSKNSMFAHAIKEKPMKMSEVKTLPWNEGRNTYYEAFGKLTKAGLASRNEKGEMSIIKK